MTSFQLRTCKACGAELLRNQQHYCNRSCANAGRRVKKLNTFTCVTCGKEYVKAIETSTACSKKCLDVWKSKFYKERGLSEDHVKKIKAVPRDRDSIIEHGVFLCDRCNRKFETNTAIRAHKATCGHVINKIACKVCGKVINERLMNWRMRKHDDAYWKVHLDKLRVGIDTRTNVGTTSMQENAFFDRLCEIYGKDNVQHKAKIEGCAHEFDFLIKDRKLLVEFDGDYWHGNNDQHDALTSKQKCQFRIDETYTKFARTAGYEIHRVWASESDKYPEVIREELWQK